MAAPPELVLMVVCILDRIFGLGVALSIGWLFGGLVLLITLLRGAWVHGPIELLAVLLCVSEPLRLAEQRDQVDLKASLRRDFRLLSDLLANACSVSCDRGLYRSLVALQ